MSLWTEFGEENPQQTHERLLQMIAYQDSQLSQLTNPLVADVQNRVESQEQALRELYRPVVNDVRKRVKRNGRRLEQLGKAAETLPVVAPPEIEPEGIGTAGADGGDFPCLVICVIGPDGKSCPSAAQMYCASHPGDELCEVADNDIDIGLFCQVNPDHPFCAKCHPSVYCPPGMELVNGKCVISCVEGTVLDELTGECVEVCPEGQHEDDEGVCVDDAVQVCCLPQTVNVTVQAPPQVCCTTSGDLDGIDIEQNAISIVCEPGTRTVRFEGEEDGGGQILQCELWEPDTEKICQVINAHIALFTQVGNTLIASIESVANAASAVVAAPVQITNTLLQAILPVNQAIQPARFFPSIREIITQFTSSLSATLIAQGAAYVGLTLVRIVVDTIESLTVGWNLGPMVMIQLRISLTKEKQILDYLQNYLWPTQIPSSGDIATMAITGEITAEHADCLWRMNSSMPVLERKIAHSRRPQPTPNDLMRLWYRYDLGMPELFNRLKEQGWQDQRDVDDFADSTKFVPPPSDSISFAVRDVFDPNLFARDLMTQEYRNQRGLNALFRANGIGDVTITGISPDTNDTVDVGLMYWIAHYVHCSPTQVNEMFHKLRPGRAVKWALPGQTPADITAMETDINVVRNLYRLNDYNPFWRDRLAAINYNVVGRIDVRRLYRNDIFGVAVGRRGFAVNGDIITPVGVAETELTETFLDIGYSPIDAARLALYTAGEYEDAKLAPRKKRVAKQVCDGIKLGLITVEDGIARLRAVGYDENDALLLARGCEWDRETRLIDRSIRYLRRAVLGGRIDLDEARNVMNSLGLVPNAIESYIMEWELDVSMRAKEPEARQLCEWFGEGLLSLQEFINRLLRLGYTDKDTQRIIAHCVSGIKGRAAREQEKMQRIIDKNKREREARERKALHAFLSARTDKHLLEWYKDGTVTINDIRQTLLMRGWSADDVQRWIIHNIEASNGSKT